jgi:lipocalin
MGMVMTTEHPRQFIIVYSQPPAAMGYWIVALGDIPPGEQQYPWAVVSAPYQYILYILARDVMHFRHHYQEYVLQWVKDHGYTQELNKPLETFQGDPCQYPPLPDDIRRKTKPHPPI